MPSSDVGTALASVSSTTVEVDTAEGLARAHCTVPSRTSVPSGESVPRGKSPPPARPGGRLVLGHGAGGGVGAPDLLAARDAALSAGWAVALVEQPWRVAGKRVAVAPPRLDVAWLEVVDALVTAQVEGTDAFGPGSPIVLGGRSAGARVACRTASSLGADGVLCLAFPLHPPGRPERSRAGELALVGGVPLLVVQGARDPFGSADDVRRDAPAGARVVEVPGDHSLRAVAQVGSAVRGLCERLASAR